MTARFRLLSVLLTLALIVACDAGPQVQWTKYAEENLGEARSSGKPTVIYCYAAWCGPCQMLKAHTFSDARVIEALDGLNRLKADLSFRESKYSAAFNQKYGIQALPTLIFYDESGREIPQRIHGFITADQLLDSLESLEFIKN